MSEKAAGECRTSEDFMRLDRERETARKNHFNAAMDIALNAMLDVRGPRMWKRDEFRRIALKLVDDLKKGGAK